MNNDDDNNNNFVRAAARRWISVTFDKMTTKFKILRSSLQSFAVPSGPLQSLLLRGPLPFGLRWATMATTDMGQKEGGCCAPFRGTGSPCNTMWHKPRRTFILPSGI